MGFPIYLRIMATIFIQRNCFLIVLILILRSVIPLHVTSSGVVPQECLIKLKESFFHDDLLYISYDFPESFSTFFRNVHQRNGIYYEMPKNYTLKNYMIFFENFTHLKIIMKSLSASNSWTAMGKFLFISINDINNINEIFEFLFETYLFKSYIAIIIDDSITIYRAKYNCDKTIQVTHQIKIDSLNAQSIATLKGVRARLY